MMHQLKHWELVGVMQLPERLEIYFIEIHFDESESDIFFHLFNN